MAAKKFVLTDDVFEAQYAEAKKAGAERDAKEPRAKTVRFDPRERQIRLELTNGAVLAFPVDLVQGIAGASEEVLRDVELAPGGRGVHFEALDAHYGVVALVAEIFGTSAWMAELGRRGGSATSEAKAVSSRANGVKGGRPRKVAAQVRTAKTARGR